MLRKTLFIYLNTIVFCFCSASLATFENNRVLSLSESYDQPKNIGFAGFVGGSSHYTWVLTILDELKDRGHNVTFFTKEDGIRFGKHFPGINTISVGPAPDLSMDTAFTGLEESSSDKSVKLVVATALQKLWSTDYPNMLELFRENKMDIVICDFFIDACYDAAKTLGIPFIISSTLELTPDSNAPYVNNLGMTVEDFSTEFQSIYRRFYDHFIEPFVILSKFGPLFKETFVAKKALGVNGPLIPYEAWKDNIKLVNSFFGLTPPRPLGSLVEQVGPIIPKQYAPLTDGLETYLESHKKIVYVSFGQHSTPSQNTIRLLLTSILENLESGGIDGIVWAVVNSQKSFPDTVTTSSKTTYSIKELFGGKYPNIRFDKWVPQIALLLHPSTHAFISHGGHGSVIESMYAGVRMIIVPSFADQFGNAMSIQRANLGVSIRLPISSNKLTEEIKRVVSDKDGKIKDSLKRMQAIVQIRSRNGPKMGADVVEEVVFSHVNGQVPHRYAASQRLSFMRAHNFDLYIILVAIILATVSVMGFALTKAVKSLSVAYKSQKKSKTL